MKDVVWVVTQSEKYENDNTLTVTTDRSKALAIYEEYKVRADNWMSYSLERWEDGDFVEHELETD